LPSANADLIKRVLAKMDNLHVDECNKFLHDMGDAAGTLTANLSKVTEHTIDAWRMVSAYTDLRKDFDILQNASLLLRNAKLESSGLTSGLLKRLIDGNHGDGAVALAQLLKGYHELVSSGTKFKKNDKMIEELAKGANFAVGERWIQRYITSHVDDFKGAEITFEEILDAGNVTRRVDVVNVVNKKRIFYEFKSVREVPPANFANQFLKDLNNPNVSEFDQLRWIFDGEKVKELKKADFINELNKVTIPPEIIKKWIERPGASQKDLIELLENKFDTIFLIR
jgi:hypothetical protein